MPLSPIPGLVSTRCSPRAYEAAGTPTQTWKLLAEQRHFVKSDTEAGLRRGFGAATCMPRARARVGKITVGADRKVGGVLRKGLANTTSPQPLVAGG